MTDQEPLPHRRGGLTLKKLKMKKEKIKAFVLERVEEGSWQSYGAGETGCEIFYRHPVYGYPVYCGHLSGDNGCNLAYNPSGEPWAESIEDKSDEWFLDVYQEIKGIENEFSSEIKKREERVKSHPPSLFGRNIFGRKTLVLNREKNALFIRRRKMR